MNTPMRLWTRSLANRGRRSSEYVLLRSALVATQKAHAALMTPQSRHDTAHETRSSDVLILLG